MAQATLWEEILELYGSIILQIRKSIPGKVAQFDQLYLHMTANIYLLEVPEV